MTKDDFNVPQMLYIEADGPLVATGNFCICIVHSKKQL